MTKIYNRADSKEKRQRLRRDMPPAEVLLWSRLRGRQLAGLKFRRQYSIGRFIVDFYCPEAKLAIELDGKSHAEEASVEYDRRRQVYIEEFGVKILRFANQDVFNNIEGVFELIERTSQARSDHALPGSPLNKGELEGVKTNNHVYRPH